MRSTSLLAAFIIGCGRVEAAHSVDSAECSANMTADLSISAIACLTTPDRPVLDCLPELEAWEAAKRDWQSCYR